MQTLAARIQFLLSSRTTAPATTAATEGLRDRHYSDSEADDAHQVRDDEDHANQSSDAEAGEQGRAAVVQSFKADVASLFAQIRRAKANGPTSDHAAQAVVRRGATAPPATAAPEDVRNVCLDDIHSLSAEERITLKRTDARMNIHEYDLEIRVGLKRSDPQMTLVTNQAAQPEKQPIEAKRRPQPRRPGLTLQRWPGKTKKS